MELKKIVDPNTGEEKIGALNLDDDGRILSCTWDEYGADWQPRTDVLPTGDTDAEKNIANYRYIDGEFIYEPQSEPEPPELTPTGEYVTYDELAAAIREGVNNYGV